MEHTLVTIKGYLRLPAVLLILLPALTPAQQTASFDGKAAVVLANDKVELTVLTTGGALARLLLRDGEPLSPFPPMGHMLCVDGFGAPSKQETAAGMPFHGEAGKRPFKILSTRDAGPVHSLTMQVWLPLAQETFTRTIEVADGENVVYVTSELENPLAFDRPVSWAEHGTLGPPFLEKGKVVVDAAATNCRVRAWKPGPIPGRLIYLRDFKWPMAPTNEGGQVDLRPVPADTIALDLAGCQMDPQRRLAFVTALHIEKRLLFGYLFRREEYPWLMNWMKYTGDEKAARGIEFSTQPFDVSRRESVELNPLFGTPTFRWLPAKSKIQSRFLLFYTKVPEGFSRVDDVRLEGGKLIVDDRGAGKRVVLNASQEL